VRRNTDTYTYSNGYSYGDTDRDSDGHAHSYSQSNTETPAQSASAADPVVDRRGRRTEDSCNQVTDLGDAGRLREVRPGYSRN